MTIDPEELEEYEIINYFEELRIDFNLKESNDVPKLIDEYVQYFNNERYSTKCKGKAPVQYRTELGY